MTSQVIVELMNNKEKTAIYILSKTKGIGPSAFKEIIKKYQSADNFLNSKTDPLYKRFKNEILKATFLCNKTSPDNYLVFGDNNYPKLLTYTNDPPLVIFYKGNVNLLNELSVSVVGTRRVTQYGTLITKEFSESFAFNKLVVVSGMAYGVDSIAHKATLNAKGKTIAVLNAGVKEPVPKGNEELFNEIIEKGLIVSEFEFLSEYDSYSFPRRNRIIAGLTSFCLVTEAPLKSGALITAELAFNYDRNVYAIPHSCKSFYGEGANYLIANGVAQLVQKPNDIYNYESLMFKTDLKKNPININEALIAKILANNHLTFEQMKESVNITEVKLRNILLDLEGLYSLI